MICLVAVGVALAASGDAHAEVRETNRAASATTHRNGDYREAVVNVLGLQKQAAPEVYCFNDQHWRYLEYGVPGAGRLLGLYKQRLPNQINLSPYVCSTLDDIAYLADRSISLRAGLAVATLIHETIHWFDDNYLRDGELTEAETECYAMQLLSSTAYELSRGDVGYAQSLAEHYWNFNYPTHNTEYQHPGCYPGGPLDLEPETETWPWRV